MLSAAVKALPALLLAFGLLLCFVLLSPFPTHEVLELIVPPQFALFLAFVFLNASLLLQKLHKNDNQNTLSAVTGIAGLIIFIVMLLPVCVCPLR